LIENQSPAESAENQVLDKKASHHKKEDLIHFLHIF
jgi:hypothetical protein